MKKKPAPLRRKLYLQDKYHARSLSLLLSQTSKSLGTHSALFLWNRLHEPSPRPSFSLHCHSLKNFHWDSSYLQLWHKYNKVLLALRQSHCSADHSNKPPSNINIHDSLATVGFYMGTERREEDETHFLAVLFPGLKKKLNLNFQNIFNLVPGSSWQKFMAIWVPMKAASTDHLRQAAVPILIALHFWPNW